MNDTQLLERLTSAYATVEPPVPTAALAEILESGDISRAGAHDDEERGAVVVPLPRPRPRMRTRHLVAAAVATFVLFGGLAVAGALPDPLQREVSSVVGHLGIDLPSPASAPAHDGPAARDTSDRPHPTSTSAPAADAGGANGSNSTGAGAVPGAPVRTTPAASSLGDIGAVTGATTLPTLPPGGNGLLPPVTVPQVTAPPSTVPQVTSPTIPPPPPPSLPLPTLPPLPLPPLPIAGL